MEKRKKIFGMLIMPILLSILLTIVTFAWFATLSKSKARTPSIGIEEPPTLIIGDETGAVLTALDLEGLQIGETYNYMFSVRALEGATLTNYTVTLIYTDNMKETITLYPAEVATLETPNAIEYKGLYFTEGTACVTNPDYSAPNAYESGDTKIDAVNGNYQSYLRTLTGDIDYYFLEISWNPDSIGAIDQKETDIVYIAAKAGHVN